MTCIWGLNKGSLVEYMAIEEHVDGAVAMLPVVSQ